jgi:hypothetical protein
MHLVRAAIYGVRGRAVPLLRGNRRFRGDGSARFAAFLDIILTLLVDAQGICRR